MGEDLAHPRHRQRCSELCPSTASEPQVRPERPQGVLGAHPGSLLGWAGGETPKALFIL